MTFDGALLLMSTLLQAFAAFGLAVRALVRGYTLTMAVRTVEPTGAQAPGPSTSSVAELLAPYRAVLLAVPAVTTLMLLAAVYLADLPVVWFGLGAVFAVPAVVTAILAVDRLKR